MSEYRAGEIIKLLPQPSSCMCKVPGISYIQWIRTVCVTGPGESATAYNSIIGHFVHVYKTISQLAWTFWVCCIRQCTRLTRIQPCG